MILLRCFSAHSHRSRMHKGGTSHPWYLQELLTAWLVSPSGISRWRPNSLSEVVVMVNTPAAATYQTNRIACIDKPARDTSDALISLKLLGHLLNSLSKTIICSQTYAESGMLPRIGNKPRSINPIQERRRQGGGMRRPRVGGPRGEGLGPAFGPSWA